MLTLPNYVHFKLITMFKIDNFNCYQFQPLSLHIVRQNSQNDHYFNMLFVTRNTVRWKSIIKWTSVQ